MLSDLSFTPERSWLVCESNHRLIIHLLDYSVRDIVWIRRNILRVSEVFSLIRKYRHLGTSLVIQQLRLCTPNTGRPGSIPGRGTRSHMLQPTPSTAKKNEYIFLKKKENIDISMLKEYSCPSDLQGSGSRIPHRCQNAWMNSSPLYKIVKYMNTAGPPYLWMWSLHTEGQPYWIMRGWSRSLVREAEETFRVNVQRTLMLLNCGTEEDSWEPLGLQGDQTSQS